MTQERESSGKVIESGSHSSDNSGPDRQPSPFPPPATPATTTTDTALLSPHRPPPAPTESTGAESTGSKSRGVLIAVGLIGLLVLVAMGGWLIVGRGDDDASSATPGLGRLPNEPVELYSVTFDEDVDVFYELVGTPERIAGRAGMSDSEELRVLDSDGTELWRREIPPGARFEMIDGDVILATPEDDDRDAQLFRFDGDNGSERWTTKVDRFDSLKVYPDSVLLFAFSESGQIFTGYDPTTGDQLGEHVVGGSDEVVVPLTTTDALPVVQDDEWFVVDERFNEISRRFSWKAMGEPEAWAYMDGEILTATGQEVTRYGDDGKRLASADLGVAEIRWVKGAGNAIWLYSSIDVCGAVRFAGAELERLWQSSEDCDTIIGRNVVRYADADPLLYLTLTDGSVINIVTGERVFAVENTPVFPFSNGFVVRNRDDATAYGWPGNQKLFSVPLGDDHYGAEMIDGGYVTLDLSDDRATITVYG